MDEFNASNTREMEISTEGFHIHLSKNENSFQSKAAPAQTTTAPTQMVEQPQHQVAENVEKPEAKEQHGTTIKAPMVGTVYLKPEPEKPSYVSVGQKVAKGDVVCIIEAMKMMTEIKSEVSGTISEILVDTEDLVEFDQPLFRVEEA